MPTFKVRPKTMSIHGRQQAIYPQTGQTMFTMAKVSRIKTLSLRHNLEVCIGDNDDEVPCPPSTSPAIHTSEIRCDSPAGTGIYVQSHIYIGIYVLPVCNLSTLSWRPA